MMADKEIEIFEWLIRNLPFDIPIACVDGLTDFVPFSRRWCRWFSGNGQHELDVTSLQIMLAVFSLFA
jgi:hypothetical protein